MTGADDAYTGHENSQAGTRGIDALNRRKLLRLALGILAVGKSAPAMMRTRMQDAVPPFPYPIPAGDLLSTCNFEHGMSSLMDRTILLHLTTLQSDASIAWRGLLPWLKLAPDGVVLDRDEIAFGDNIMLSMSVAMVLGAGELVKPETAALANEFLNRQRSEGGYRELFDGARGLLRGAVDRQGQPQNQYYIDRFFNEFRSGVAFAVAYFGVDERAWSNLALLSHEMKSYFASCPAVGVSHEVLNYVTWNGSAHQLSWPLLFLPEHELNPDLAVAHTNALFTMLDSARRQELLGVPAASAVPSTSGYLYSGEHGEVMLAESGGNSTAVRSIYGLAPYYTLLDDAGRPALLSWFGAYASEPGMRGRYGLFDAVDQAGRIAQVNLAIDNLTTALIGSPAHGYLVRHLESEHVMNELTRLYSLFRGPIPAVDADLPVPLVRAREPLPITGSGRRRTHPT